MRTPDLSPLHRFTVGFDHMARLLDAASRLDESAPAYPPYNIEKHSEDRYRISMAVAGFAESDLDITVADNALIVRGRHARDEDAAAAEAKPVLLHHGIAMRAFERRFQLADHIKVTGAALVNGLLHISLERIVPEEKKPRRIEISTGPQQPQALPPKAA